MCATDPKKQQVVETSSLRAAAKREKAIDFVLRMRLKNWEFASPGLRAEVSDFYSELLWILARQVIDRGDWPLLSEKFDGGYGRHSGAYDAVRQANDSYDRFVKARVEFQDVEEYLIGQTILDIGCGNGRFAQYCVDKGHRVFTADVKDDRLGRALDLPFFLISPDSRLPLADNCIHTALVMMVLHHIPSSRFGNLLTELHRIATRVIVREDVYGFAPSMFSKTHTSSDQVFTEFSRLSHSDQLAVLTLWDFLINIIERRQDALSHPFNFLTIDEWDHELRTHGLNPIAKKVLGMRRAPGIWGSCHAIIIADKGASKLIHDHPETRTANSPEA